MGTGAHGGLWGYRQGAPNSPWGNFLEEVVAELCFEEQVGLRRRGEKGVLADDAA